MCAATVFTTWSHRLEHRLERLESGSHSLEHRRPYLDPRTWGLHGRWTRSTAAKFASFVERTSAASTEATKEVSPEKGMPEHTGAGDVE
jgi:hypothetical protein